MSRALRFIIAFSALFQAAWAGREGAFVGLVGDRAVGSGGATEQQAFFSRNGHLGITSTTSGTFSGVLRWEGKVHALAGKWDSNGRASVSVSRSGKSGIAVTLQHSTTGLGKVTGSVSVAGVASGFDLKRTDAWEGGGNHPLGGKRYSVLMVPPAGLAVGCGILSVYVGLNGQWTLSGWMGNGEGVASRGGVVDGGSGSWVLPFYGLVNGTGGGVASGGIEIWKTEKSEGSDLGGSVVWLKRGSAGVPKGTFLKTLEVVGTLHALDGAEMGTGLGGENFSMSFAAGVGGLGSAVAQSGIWPSAGRPTVSTSGLGKFGMDFRAGIGRFEGGFESGTGSGKRASGYRGMLLSRNVVLADGQTIRGGGYYGNGLGGGWVLLTSSAVAVVRPQSAVVSGGMVLVKGGALPSGSELAGQSVSDFWIGKYEVTWGEWKAVREWGVGKGYDLAGVGKGSGDDHPVWNVSWYDVVKWSNARSEKEGLGAVYWVDGGVYRSGEYGSYGSGRVEQRGGSGYRLPLEAEWEWAARGGVSSKGYVYSGSDDLNEVGWYDANSGDGTNPVGRKKGNELGLYDMSGNVWEWCWELWDGTWYRRLRGGSWRSDADSAQVAARDDCINPAYRVNDSGGFRLARSSGQ